MRRVLWSQMSHEVNEREVTDIADEDTCAFRYA
jgi:hypothetical protein